MGSTGEYLRVVERVRKVGDEESGRAVLVSSLATLLRCLVLLLPHPGTAGAALKRWNNDLKPFNVRA